MGLLENWLTENYDQLVEDLQDVLSRSETAKESSYVTSEAIVDALQEYAKTGALMRLQTALSEWLSSTETLYNATSNPHLADWLNVQDCLRQTAYQYEDAINLSDKLDRFLNQATLYVSNYMTGLAASANLMNTRTEVDRLRLANTKLQKHKTDFISVAAHELKTPLTLIEGYAKMLENDFLPEDYPRAANMIKGIINGTGRLREIIEDMIDISIIEMDIVELNKQEVWPSRILEIVTTEMQKQAADRSITIHLDVDELAETSIQGDPERLHQVFVELLENAIKYTPNDGDIWVNSYIKDNALEVTVKDKGIGLEEQDIDVIFEKFFSLGEVGLHSTSKTKFKGGGPGMGLAIAKGIVDAHEGEIWVESEGHDEKTLPGACFYVRLPIQQQVPTQNEANT